MRRSWVRILLAVQNKSNYMEELLFNQTLDGESLVKDILDTDGVGSITDDDGKSYWWNTIDKSKTYQVRKYKYDRALQDYSVISYKIREL